MLGAQLRKVEAVIQSCEYRPIAAIREALKQRESHTGNAAEILRQKVAIEGIGQVEVSETVERSKEVEKFCHGECEYTKNVSRKGLKANIF